VKINFQFDSTELDSVICNDGEYFLLYGQSSVEKGWHTLEKIIPLLRTKIKIKMIFSNEKTKTEMLIKFGLEKYVLEGIIETECNINKREDILSRVANCKAVLIPSYYPTTGEFVLLESLILGKPVLVFNAGVHNDIIKHEVNGMIANVGNFEKFANNVDLINTQPALRKIISKNAKNTAQVIFASNNNEESIKRLFN
jgi:glycosyltransferase involved in cell wall biosynthesis